MSGSETSSECDGLQESVSDTKAALEKRCPAEIKFLYERVGKLIRYVTGRIDHFENAESRIFTVSVTLVGLGVTVLTFGINYLVDAPWLRWSVLILIAAAILAMIIHLNQSRRSYSWQKAVQSPWFYVGNIPTFKGLKWHARKEENVKKAFCKDYAQNYAQMAKENWAGALEKDIGQLAKVYTILAYKKIDVDRTTKVIEWGLLLFILSMFILYFVNLVMPLP